MESLDYSEEEIQLQLAALGYSNVPKERLREFKRGGLIFWPVPAYISAFNGN